MCNTIAHKGQEIETVGELKLAVGKVIARDEGELDGDNFCLCNVDLAKTAEVNGLFYYVDIELGDLFLPKGRSQP